MSAKLLEKAEADSKDEAPTVEDLAKKLDEATATVDSLKSDIAKLGEGGSSQTETPDTSTETVSADEVKKSFEAAGLDPDLAGIV